MTHAVVPGSENSGYEVVAAASHPSPSMRPVFVLVTLLIATSLGYFVANCAISDVVAQGGYDNEHAEHAWEEGQNDTFLAHPAAWIEQCFVNIYGAIFRFGHSLYARIKDASSKQIHIKLHLHFTITRFPNFHVHISGTPTGNQPFQLLDPGVEGMELAYILLSKAGEYIDADVMDQILEATREDFSGHLETKAATYQRMARLVMPSQVHSEGVHVGTLDEEVGKEIDQEEPIIDVCPNGETIDEVKA